MKKLFYLLTAVSFLICSCSDDDKVTTEDVNYNVILDYYESNENIGQYYLFIRTKENWFAEKSLGEIQLTAEEKGNTLYLHFGDLKYVEYRDPMLSRSPATRTTMVGWASAPPVLIPDNISKIIATRRGNEDIYTVNRTDEEITFTQNGSYFSSITSAEYLLRPKNAIAFYCYKNETLLNEMINHIKASVSLKPYAYNKNKDALWHVMRQDSEAVVYSYENADDYQKIEAAFKGFCNTIPWQDPLSMYIEDWTGKSLNYASAIK